MEHDARVVWHDDMLRYDFGPSHPMSPKRLALTMELARQLQVLSHLDVVDPPAADDKLLLLAHSQEYIDAVRRCGVVPGSVDIEHGLGSPDVPTFHDMHAASSRVAAATVEAARSVVSGEVSHAFNPAGGLHHAMPQSASGFCVYNDLTVAIAWLLRQGVERVAYIDVDVHHGDGVEAKFWNDPRVLTISIHESPHTLFPGTGWADDVGGPAALGYAVNIAVPASTGDESWLRALAAVVPQLLYSFGPQVVVSQHGCDSHRSDPLANLMLSVDGQRMATEAIHRWSHEFADGRWVATGGGGYAISEVVPRTWTLLMAELSGNPLPPDTAIPLPWRDLAHTMTATKAPSRMTDGQHPQWTPWSSGATADPVDAAIRATRSAVFSHHGRNPDHD